MIIKSYKHAIANDATRGGRETCASPLVALQARLMLCCSRTLMILGGSGVLPRRSSTA